MCSELCVIIFFVTCCSCLSDKPIFFSTYFLSAICLRSLATFRVSLVIFFSISLCPLPAVVLIFLSSVTLSFILLCFFCDLSTLHCPHALCPLHSTLSILSQPISSLQPCYLITTPQYAIITFITPDRLLMLGLHSFSYLLPFFITHAPISCSECLLSHHVIPLPLAFTQ